MRSHQSKWRALGLLALLGGCAGGEGNVVNEDSVLGAGSGAALPTNIPNGQMGGVAGSNSPGMMPPTATAGSGMMQPAMPGAGSGAPSVPMAGSGDAPGDTPSVMAGSDAPVPGEGPQSPVDPVDGVPDDPPADPGAPQPGDVNGGACCSDGNCLCHGPDPTELTSRNGPFEYDSYSGSSGTIYYPTDAEPPFAGVAICAGFLNTGIEMLSWGSFYASHGIVTVVVTTLPTDIPVIRAALLLGGIEELKAENSDSSSPLSGKMSGRYGTSGYSMGGGGTTIAAGEDPTLRTSVGLAPWGGSGRGVTVPTLLLCGSSDAVAPCYMADGVYGGMDDSVPKMQVTVSGAGHLAWFGPDGLAGEYALAFQKVFLEGDERWKPLLLEQPSGILSGGSMVTSIK